MRSEVPKGVVSLVLASLFTAVGLTFAEAPVSEGEVAPDFELSDSTGRAYKLSDFRGKNAVVLEFFRSGDW